MDAFHSAPRVTSTRMGLGKIVSEGYVCFLAQTGGTCAAILRGRGRHLQADEPRQSPAHAHAIRRKFFFTVKRPAKAIGCPIRHLAR